MKSYDFILAGGGLAGLSLAYHLVSSPLRERSILIVDKNLKNRNDRTWCFWTDRATPFDGIVQRAWRQFQFCGDDFEKVIELGAYSYKSIRGIDLYEFVRNELARYHNVEFLHGTVSGVENTSDRASISVDGNIYDGQWVFDSRFNLAAFRPDSRRYHYLKQYFKGWMVETRARAFNTDTPYFMDMRTPQKNELCFFYVLPFSERKALVEYVTSSPEEYDEALKRYVEKTLGIHDYAISSSEGGVNPLTDYVFARRAGRRVMNIGIRGGRIKASTGYAFLRIQRDSEKIVESLIRHGHPFDVPADSRRYRLYDSLMLDVIQRHGNQIKPIFTALFKNNPVERVFRFLDETASPAENSLLIASLPPRVFLQSLFRLKAFHSL